MKLIMESWRSQILLENTTGARATVGDFRVAMAVMRDPEAAKEIATNAEKYMELYEKVNQVKPTRKGLRAGLMVLSLFAASVPLLPFLPVIAGSLATGVSIASLALAGTQFIGELVEALQDKKLQSKEEIRPIMKALGIDQDLLAIIENDLEDQFFKNVIAPQLQGYLKDKPHDEVLPNLTLEFQQFLNNQTKLKDSVASQVSPKTQGP